MPVVLRLAGYKFFFFSNEGSPREPLHIHVRKGEKVAKFWLEPEISLAESYRMTSGELRKLIRAIAKNYDLIRKAWHDHFGE